MGALRVSMTCLSLLSRCIRSGLWSCGVYVGSGRVGLGGLDGAYKEPRPTPVLVCVRVCVPLIMVGGCMKPRWESGIRLDASGSL